jgi:hypothetical protein
MKRMEERTTNYGRGEIFTILRAAGFGNGLKRWDSENMDKPS